MTQKTIIGILFLVLNIPFGWFGAALCVYLGKKYNKKFYYFLSVIVYALSWLMLVAGIYLCGKDYAKTIFENYVSKYIYPISISCLVIIALIYIINKVRKNKNLH